jgi:D-alanyl-D-alanine carboxypeptidase
MTQTRSTFIRSIAIGLAALAAASIAGSAWAEDKYSAIVIDARTNEVLLEDQANEERYPASLTKMMTLYMLFEALDHNQISMSTRMTASRHASRMPASHLGMRRGQTITVAQAINAIVVQSANDVAVVIAERLAGSEPRFAALMTAKARDLGMRDTRFVNANGLPDPRQHTTARDMAILGQALWRDYPQYYHVFSTEGWTWGRRYARSHNRLVGAVAGVDGIKTGYTRASGFNLVSSAERNGRRVIVAVMGGETAQARDNQVAYLIEGAFEEYQRRTLDPAPATATFANLPMQRLDVRMAGAAPGATVTQVFSTAPRGPMSALPGGPAPAVSTLSSVESADQADGQGDDNDAADKAEGADAPFE